MSTLEDGLEIVLVPFPEFPFALSGGPDVTLLKLNGLSDSRKTSRESGRAKTKENHRSRC